MATLRFKEFRSFILLVLAGSVVCPVLAQDQEVPANERVIVEREVSPGAKIGAISILSTSDEPPDLSQMQTVTFTVPVEDIPYYQYYVGKIKDSGAGWSGVAPDEYGVIQQIVDPGNRVVGRYPQGDISQPVITRIMDNPLGEGEFEYYYLFAQDLETGNFFYTFDIPQVPLHALLNSLASSLSAGLPPREEFGIRPRDRVLGITEENRNIMLSLLGEQMSLDETLDRIYQLTGCAVYKEEYSLLIESCD